ncbi:MAG: putative spermidine/putrescine transport system substrate-binding protein, partial [Frankiaceae bacterium]|nr:putative spermidine/putrescine transport system substrate-binding protein [Frankiaceae bacterium]
MPTTKTAVVALTAGVALALAGCSSSTTTPAGPATTASGAGTSTSTGTGSGSPTPSAVQHAAPPALPTAQAVGAGEGALNIIVWAGYAEDGSNDKTVDWVHPFEKATGCKVNTKIAGTSDEMVNLMKTGQYDVVSASGDASLRLIASGDVEPVNTDLVPNYADVFDGLKMKPWNSVNGVAYGIPHGRGANLLMYNTDVVKPAPTSWSVVFDGASAYKGKVTAYDSPIYIADAAVYLMKTKP